MPDWPHELERGAALRPIAGETRSGDLAVFAAYDGGALAGAIDGLGHGADAADAAEQAARVIAAHPEEEAGLLLGRCHEALRGTRGAVMTLAWFDLRERRLSWTGVGNVEGRLIRGGGRTGAVTEGAFTRGGVVGYNLPKVRVTSAALGDGDIVVLASDGIESDFSHAVEIGGSAQAIADRILAGHAKGTDDALVVIIRSRLP